MFPGSCHVEQLLLCSQQHMVTTVEDYVVRTEMVDLESQEEDNPKCILFFKPMRMRMGLRRSNECTLCQRDWKQREDDQHESESGYIGAPSLLTASSVGNSGNVTRVEGVDLLDP